jgi:hypothetical protein
MSQCSPQAGIIIIPLIVPASGCRGRPAGILHGCPLGTLGDQVRFDAWEEGGDPACIISFAGLIALPRPFDTFVKATAGPYAAGRRFDARAFTVSVIVVPLVSVVPEVELAVSQDGVLIE